LIINLNLFGDSLPKYILWDKNEIVCGRVKKNIASFSGQTLYHQQARFFF